MFVMKLKLKWTPASCKWTISFLHLKEQTAELYISISSQLSSQSSHFMPKEHGHLKAHWWLNQMSKEFY